MHFQRIHRHILWQRATDPNSTSPAGRTFCCNNQLPSLKALILSGFAVCYLCLLPKAAPASCSRKVSKVIAG